MSDRRSKAAARSNWQRRRHACASCREWALNNQDELFDWIDPETGEVFQIDLLWHKIYSHCHEDPAFFERRAPLTSAIFRTFIINNNSPLSCIELYERLQKKSPELILRTIGSRRVYNGIKAIPVSI